MKVCLINPPIQDFYSTSMRRQPLGLLYIASILKGEGHIVSLINCHTPKSHPIACPEEFAYLKKYIHADKDSKFPFNNYNHFGMSFQEIDRQVKLSEADIFFISSLFTTYYQEVWKIISIIQSRKKNCMIAVGGYHAALYPEFFLKTCGVDYVITGEGERSSVELLKCLKDDDYISDVPNLAYVEKNDIRYTRKSICEINSLPFPDRDFLKNRDIRVYGKNFISMIASRGCPNSCKFCTGKSIWGNSYRYRNTESILEEIDLCINKYNADIINLEDDNLFPTVERGKELLNNLIIFKKKTNKELEFTAMNGISLDAFDDIILSLMKEAGFRELNISLVSHSMNLQEKLGRPFDSYKFGMVAEKAKHLKMNVRAYFILGLPEQTIDEVENTISFLKDLEIKIFPSIYYNVNSPQEEWKMQRSSAFYNETEHLTRDDLLYYFNKCMSNYYKC